MKNNYYSSLKIFHHKDLLDMIQKQQRVSPIYIRLKPTNLCNHHCSYCTYGSGEQDNKTINRDLVNRTDMIPWKKMKEIICDMGQLGVKAVTLSGGGEPLTYPYIIDAVQMLKEKNIEISLISNGQLLKGEIAKKFYDAKWVRISFDSPNESEYATFRHVSGRAFQEVCHNIQFFSEHKSKECVLGINFVINKTNYKRVYEAAEFLKDLGADNIKFAAVVDNSPHYHIAIKDSVIEQIHRAKSNLEDNEFQIINNYETDWTDKNFTVQPFNQCYTCKMITVIAADSKVYYCHTRAYDSKAVLGDLAKQSLRKMWFSKETTQKLKDLKPQRDCQNFCVYEERNILIQNYFDVDYNHINFI